MAIEVFANFVNTQLAANIGPTATTLSVSAGAGASLPQPGAGQFGRLELTDATTGNIHEIMLYTGVSGDSVSGLTRGAEGTTALNWSAGDLIFSGPTAGAMGNLVQLGAAQTNAAIFAPDTGSVNALVLAPSPAIGTPTNGTRLLTRAVASNTGATTVTVSGVTYPLTGNAGALSGGELVANGNLEIAWNSAYSSFEIVTSTRASQSAAPAAGLGQSVTWGQMGANVSVALSNANVTLSPAQYFGGGTIVLTGALTANVNLGFPVSIPGRWQVRNNTTGNFQVTATTGGGTTAEIPQRSSAGVFSDGTNVWLGSTTNAGLQLNTPSASISSATVLTGACAGTYQPLSGASPYTVTLPAANTVRRYACVTFYSVASANVTIARAGADTILSGLSTVTSVVMTSGDNLTLMSDGVSAWIPTQGAAALGLTGQFAQVSGFSGTKQLPGGLMLIWGASASPSAANTTTVTTFPASFPIAIWHVFLTDFAAASNFSVFWTVTNKTLGNFTAMWGAGVTAPGSTNSRTAEYLAIGQWQ